MLLRLVKSHAEIHLSVAGTQCSWITQALTEPLRASAVAVGQIVGQIVPVDGESYMLIPLVLLRRSAAKVPVTGIELLLLGTISPLLSR